MGCSTHATQEPKTDYLQCAERIAQSEIQHNPELWMADFLTKPKWDYTQGLIAKAMLETYLATGDTTYLAYVEAFADYFIQEDGSIRTYDLTKYNLDRVNGGNFLYLLDSIDSQPRYQAAIRLLRSQLATQPRTTEGGFWHKQIYPSQMWLDGLYMAEPFYAHYALWDSTADAEAIFDDVVLQFSVVDAHTLNPATGLNYHGWDESHAQAWADSLTGCSPHTWGRAEGWYVMAICDVLDYLPKSHTGRAKLIAILNRVCTALLRYQDPTTGMWYQVPDLPEAEGNYTESTCSAMFCYALAKGTHGLFARRVPHHSRPCVRRVVAECRGRERGRHAEPYPLLRRSRIGRHALPQRHIRLLHSREDSRQRPEGYRSFDTRGVRTEQIAYPHEGTTTHNEKKNTTNHIRSILGKFGFAPCRPDALPD